MDAKYYCDHMQSELTGLKARVYNVIAAVNGMGEEKRAALGSEVSALHALVAELSGKIDALKNQCPVDWSAEKTEIEKQRDALLTKINWWDEEHIAGGYVGG